MTSTESKQKSAPMDLTEDKKSVTKDSKVWLMAEDELLAFIRSKATKEDLVAFARLLTEPKKTPVPVLPLDETKVGLVIIKYFQRTQEAFEELQKKDKFKADKCTELGVNLLQVPYNVQFDELHTFLINECEKRNIEVPNKEFIDIDELDIY